MKRFLVTGLLVAVGLIVSSVAPAAAQSATKIGYINSQRVMAQAPGASEAQKTFEADMQRYRAQVDSMGNALERAQQEFQRQQATLSAEARQQRQARLQEQFQAYQQRLAELEDTAQRRQQELVSPIMQRITTVIEQLRKDGNYAIIFDASAGSMITADPALDLTEQVLERLRSSQ